MNRAVIHLIPLACLLLAPPAATRAAEPVPPEGFRALFNGRDLTGWYGLNRYWRVEEGELVNDGTGPYAVTEEEFGDIELFIEYKTVPRADSGIYLRGTPQVQIWDTTPEGGKTGEPRFAERGSGGLFNNTRGAPGQLPLVNADRPFGEWNAFRIRQAGDRTWVWLNGRLVVDGAVMENFWDRSRPLPAKGPIMLQTHGGEIRWRNVFVREIPAEEAERLLRKTSTPVPRS
jgi:hypothetical protein